MGEAELIERARACIGARFRAQGRDPAGGLDCVGLVAFACDRPAPDDYAPRGERTRRIVREMAGAGFVAIDPGRARPGDVVMLRAGPAQLHLAVLTGQGFVHADARLRRVVETPGAPGWPVEGAWRMAGG